MKNRSTRQNELPFITVCIPVYNSNWCLKHTLKALYRADYPHKLLRLVFVDSCSTDGTYEFLQDFREKHENEYGGIIIKKINKRGLTFARNICMKYAKGFIFWLDSDVVVPPNVLKVLLSHFQQDHKLGWASAPYLRENPTFREKIIVSKMPRPYGYVDFAEIGAALIRPEVWKSVGTFNEKLGYPFSCPWDTNDYCARIRKAGWKILLDASVHCVHSYSNVGNIIRQSPCVKTSSRSVVIFNTLKRSIRYYFEIIPIGVHEIIKVGDLNYVARILYYFLLPYIAIYAFLSRQPLFLLYVLPSIVYYLVVTDGWMMKPIVCLFGISGKVVIAQGYACMLIKMLAKNFLKLLKLL